MANEKIEKLKKVLSEHSSMINSRQEYLIFPEYIIGKTKELQRILCEAYGISGKRNVISLAVLFLLDEIEEKNKTKTDGK